VSCTKGMTACRRGCLHRAMVEEYRAWVDSWHQRREDRHHMQLELDEYAQLHPRPTFHQWLVERATPHR